VQLEPVTDHIDGLSQFHIRLDQNLYDLVNDNQNGTKDKELSPF